MDRSFLLLIVLFQSFTALTLQAQQAGNDTNFKVVRPRVFDHAKLFSAEQYRSLDSILNEYWDKEIADMVVVGLDEHYPDINSFDKYVQDHLTGYALGSYGANNGVVIAISKELGHVCIQNGYSMDKMLEDSVSRRIIERNILPSFSSSEYFSGVLAGVKQVAKVLEGKRKEQDFTNVSAIFRPQIFEKIREFVLERGAAKTFRNIDRDNPSYSFSAQEVFLGPSSNTAFLRQDFKDRDFYEMTIRDKDGELFQFIYLNEVKGDQLFVHQKMQPDMVYWWNPKGRLLSKDVWPILWQLEDEIAHHNIQSDLKPFYEYEWKLTKEFDPAEGRYIETQSKLAISFFKSELLVNGKPSAAFDMNTIDRLLTLRIHNGKQVPFALYRVDDLFYYRYMFNKSERKLYLVPLDEKEGREHVSVEGRTLVFEISEI